MVQRHDLQLVDELTPLRHKRNNKGKRQRQQTGLVLNDIAPMTEAQRQVFEEYNQDQNLFLHGCAGTGKSFVALYLAIRDVLEKRDNKREVIIVRSAVATRDAGFLPGNLKEKTKVLETPYRALCSDMFNRGDAYDVLTAKCKIRFVPTSYLRGETWDDAIIIVDESQNLSFQELNSVITRVGDNSRILFCGDHEQDDLTSRRYNEESGIEKFRNILRRMKSFSDIDFKIEDVVRSGLVREYLEAYYE